MKIENRVFFKDEAEAFTARLPAMRTLYARKVQTMERTVVAEIKMTAGCTFEGSLFVTYMLYFILNRPALFPHPVVLAILPHTLFAMK